MLCVSSFLISACATANIYQKPGVDISKYKKIAVTKFLCSSDESAGQEVSDLMALEFIKKNYNVIERTQLAALVNENELSMMGITDTARPQLKLMGINGLIFGTVSSYSNVPGESPIFVKGKVIATLPTNRCTASLSIKMVDVDSGQVVWIANGSNSDSGMGLTPNKVMQDVITIIAEKIPQQNIDVVIPQVLPTRVEKISNFSSEKIIQVRPDETPGPMEQKEQRQKKLARQVNADLTEYEKVTSSKYGQGLEAATWKAMISSYPEAKDVKVGDVDGMLSVMGLTRYGNEVITLEEEKQRIEKKEMRQLEEKPNRTNYELIQLTYTDLQTGLMWAARDNGVNIDWKNAKQYCDNYCLCGFNDWRMPTIEELVGLYKSGIHKNKINLSGPFLWALETRGSKAAYVHFPSGNKDWDYSISSLNCRIIPVRSCKRVEGHSDNQPIEKPSSSWEEFEGYQQRDDW